MLPGAVCRQWKRCGKAGCKCSCGALHGPYFYRFWREDGRLRKAYVKSADVQAVRAACDDYRERQRLFREFRDIGRREWSLLAGLLTEAFYG
jgi:hypothetical protein